MHQKNSPASATPIVSGDRLYVHFGHLARRAGFIRKILWRQTDLKFLPSMATAARRFFERYLSSTATAPAIFRRRPGRQDRPDQVEDPRNSPSHRMFSFSTPLAIQVDGRNADRQPPVALSPRMTRRWPGDLAVGYGKATPLFRDLSFRMTCSSSARVRFTGSLSIKPAGAKGDVTATHVA